MALSPVMDACEMNRSVTSVSRALIVAYSLYIIGLCMAILVAFIVHIHGKNDSAQNALLIELPEYKTPNGRTVAIYVWDKVKDYLSKAGGFPRSTSDRGRTDRRGG